MHPLFLTLPLQVAAPFGCTAVAVDPSDLVVAADSAGRVSQLGTVPHFYLSYILPPYSLNICSLVNLQIPTSQPVTLKWRLCGLRNGIPTPNGGAILLQSRPTMSNLERLQPTQTSNHPPSFLLA